MEARMQAELLYALRAITRYMTWSDFCHFPPVFTLHHCCFCGTLTKKRKSKQQKKRKKETQECGIFKTWHLHHLLEGCRDGLERKVKWMTGLKEGKIYIYCKRCVFEPTTGCPARSAKPWPLEGAWTMISPPTLPLLRMPADWLVMFLTEERHLQFSVESPPTTESRKR